MLLGAAALAASVVRPSFTAGSPGTFGSDAWKSAAHERFEQTDVYLTEDRDAVYVAFSADGSQNDPDDAVTLYLWSDKTAYAFTVDAQGNRRSWSSAGSAGMPQWTAHEEPSKGGYSVTMRLPRSFFSGARSHWLAQFARVLPQRQVSYTWPESTSGMGDVRYSAAFDSAPQSGAFTTLAHENAEPKVTAAGDKGVVVMQTRDNLAFSASAEQDAGTQQTSASLGWKSPDDRTSANVERSASADSSGTAIQQTLSVGYDNGANMRVSAGVDSQAGSSVSDASKATADYYDFSLYGKSGSFDMRWNQAGSQYDPSGEGAPAAGTAGYTLSASHAFGNVSIDAGANRYHDDLGNLFSANESAAIAAALSPALAFNVSAAANAATPYTSVPYFQDSAGLRYGEDGRQASVSFHEDHLPDGTAQASLNGGFTLPLLRRTDISLGYQNAAGIAGVTFSFEDRLPIGLLRATFDNANTPFSSPGFSIKFVSL